jgi:hypothetical protein
MAKAATNYLRGNPDPNRNYECKWSLGPLGIPAFVPLLSSTKEAADPISHFRPHWRTYDDFHHGLVARRLGNYWLGLHSRNPLAASGAHHAAPLDRVPQLCEQVTQPLA